MIAEKNTTRATYPLGRVAAAVLLAFAIAACSSDEPPAYVERPVEELYNGALDALQVGEYEEAARLFDEVERQHPYSEWASKAQLMAAYAFYQENRYDEAINALDRFIELHPGSPDVSYAFYLKAISYYEQISDVARDQKMTTEALNALEDLARRFPNSKYTRDAELKIDLALDHLAGKHMTIGRFYQDRSEYLAAINRFRTVIERYQTTTHVPEALHRLVESYMAIGILDEAKATAAVLGHNFPGSDWYIDSYALLTGENLRPEESEGSWISSIF
ncbi:outer membrane protein assembly factor BamD [Pelagibius litoralis]|uniref:Outer membrane protein assembly factor BamD n=1 Tax=Pelagibius litoralis TaxID=374515 RepID=A0A967C2U4_9PROT|nr:outer membrane protein assembly factor BamD [Pelagibius litoralis]NIA68633.1 outer membrane protein assembly factor BamD [Pelagibius litoralis]